MELLDYITIVINFFLAVASFVAFVFTRKEKTEVVKIKNQINENFYIDKVDVFDNTKKIK